MNDLLGKKIALIKGGLSGERDVSLSTGKAFAEALKKLKLEFVEIDAQDDLPVKLYESKPDIALIALHGKYAEDGSVQGICEYLKIPYTGSGILSSALCMNKVFAKQIFEQNNIPTPKYEVININAQKSLISPFGYPVVVKPPREGSSLGVTIAANQEEYQKGILLAHKFDTDILVEEYIDGKEITVAVLGDRALTPLEIAPKVDFYDYKNKYTKGMTDYHIPARINDSLNEKCRELAIKTFKVCNMHAYGRIDFRVSSVGEVFVIEANTLPGCTETSLVPKAAAFEGISFEEVIEKILRTARLEYFVE
ncbi:MAG: D-alanine--D-alanine ligase [Bdellovibrionales bacterium]|nr:D-alanine--D-alanine ligase [Bdellovibrionales bacterium]